MLSMEPLAAVKKADGTTSFFSRQSRRSIMIRVKMKCSRGQCTDLRYLPYSWEKPRKTSARIQFDEGTVRPVIASNGLSRIFWACYAKNYRFEANMTFPAERVGKIFPIHVLCRKKEISLLESCSAPKGEELKLQETARGLCCGIHISLLIPEIPEAFCV